MKPLSAGSKKPQLVFQKKQENDLSIYSRKQMGFVQSLSRKGNCYDNSYCESWFSLLKRELGHRVYSGMNEARSEIFEWIEGWYNTHTASIPLCGHRSLLEFEKTMFDKEEKTS